MERARDHDAVEAGELIAGEIVVGHPALHMEIFAVVTGMEGAHGNHEPGVHPLMRPRRRPKPSSGEYGLEP